MTSKRALWPALAIIVILSLLLGACAPAAPPPAPAEAPAAEAPAPAATEAAPVPTEAAAEEAVVEVAVTPTPVADLEGKVVISFQNNDTQTFEALCAAYEKLHPKVDCVTELKPPEGYQEWIRTQFAGGVPAASLVNGNVVADLVLDKQFLDLTSYFDQVSPYTGKPWREDFDASALANMRNPVTGETFLLNTETVQVLWFYNKQAFEAAGILGEAEALAQTDKNQPTWDQLLSWCDALTDSRLHSGCHRRRFPGLLGDPRRLAGPHVCRPVYPR